MAVELLAQALHFLKVHQCLIEYLLSEQIIFHLTANYNHVTKKVSQNVKSGFFLDIIKNIIIPQKITFLYVR